MDLQQKLTCVFIIIFALLMGIGAHYFQHNQGGSGLELAQNNVVWIFFSVLISLGLWKITVQQKIFYSRFTVVLLSAFILFYIPLFYPNNELADQSYTRLIGLFAGILLFISLQQFQFDKKNLEKLLLLIVLAGFIQACYSLMQDYLLPANNIFGYDVGYGRPYGIFQQPNVLASFMATTLILAGYLLQQIKDKKLQIFLLLSALLNMWVITITVSRTGYLGLLIAFVLFIPWAWQSSKRKFGIFILAIFLGLGLASTKGGDILGKRNIANMTEGGGRLTHYSNSWDMIKKHPLIGYGYGGFEKNYLINTAERVKNSKSKPEHQHLTHPHNEILFWAIEGGVVPIVAILLLVIAFIHLLGKFRLTHAMALSTLVIPIAVHTQTEYPFYHSALHWLVLLVLVFYIDSQSENSRQKMFRPTFALRAVALLTPLFTTLFMLSNLHTISKITAYERNEKPNIQLLLDVVNPLVFADRFEFHLNNFRLRLASQMDQPEDLQKIIDSTEKTIESKPKAFFYTILYFAYLNNQQPEKAQKTLDYALYLYPEDHQLANIDKQTSQAAASSSAQASPVNVNEEKKITEQ
ncbi:O-antigen polymerase [Psychromonas ingrahamii 37]|uniref:O-antigen polymerase n=1 Tax=Psychromonas ingrahamii (strain DSM 17664 / CCUG 51855 / 37) TaxID=357804 RepID=A1SRW5_PSYIN|nr:PglL family O-oligosaccharyltransferase [Psychromonas ingrahamii]ABM02230.1 O-antigen polymerase [Psychromonas ingrahamii 37]